MRLWICLRYWWRFRVRGRPIGMSCSSDLAQPRSTWNYRAHYDPVAWLWLFQLNDPPAGIVIGGRWGTD